MSSAEQACYTLVNLPSEAEPPSEQKLREDLEKADTHGKTEALKKVICMIINGEKFHSSLLMTVVKFVMPVQDHTLKKLLLIFWEVVPKYEADGKLLHEMILVCDAYRKDLQHPNEFIRGSTLRFLCKLKEAELLEPLMPSIRQCLEYRHTYVRRNAVLAIFTIYKSFDFLIPDAPELIANFLENEQDASCKRNAFMMLLHVDQERALNFLSTCLDQVHTFGDILQLVIVELIYKVCHANPGERARFIRCVYNLLQSSSPSVRYEAAATLVTLSTAPTAIRAVATCYIELVLKESDNNVKLIVMDRLISLRENHEKILQELLMDVLRILSSTDLEVRRKTLDLALDLVSSRTIEEMVAVLRKEVLKTGSAVELEETGRYRQLLVRTLHQACVRFPDTAPSIIPTLCDFLPDATDSDGASQDVLLFLREAAARYGQLRPLVLEKLMDIFPSLKSMRLHRNALWILCEFSNSREDMQNVMTLVRQLLGELPIVEDEMRRASGSHEEESCLTALSSSSAAGGGANQQRVTADGTYATQTAMTSSVAGKDKTAKKEEDRPALRKYFMTGDFFIAATLANDLAKMALRYCTVVKDTRRQNAFVAEAMFIISSIIHFGRSGLPSKAISEDELGRMWLCLKVLAERSPETVALFCEKSRTSLEAFLLSSTEDEKDKSASGGTSGGRAVHKKVEADEPVRFLQLAAPNELGELEDRFDLTLNQALLGSKTTNRDDDLLASSKLNKVTQLTGFSDPVYSEAYVHVNQYDIVLDVLIVNQTADTLQNLTLELATLGDLKLVEKPSAMNLAGHDFANIKANIKVSSTENGIIFGNIVYDVRGAAGDRNCVVLNDIHIDIMDYIVGAHCSEADFRRMWSEFEWENKVAVNTNITNLRAYLDHLMRATNMRCLTPEKVLSGDCGFLAANLYARSIFGEDALANLSLEKPFGQADGAVSGHVRIRAKSQGMAVTLGDKINLSQKALRSDTSCNTTVAGAAHAAAHA